MAAAITRAWRPYRWRGYLVGLGAGLLVGAVIAPVATTTLAVGSAVAGGPALDDGLWDEIAWSFAFVGTFVIVGAAAITTWLPFDFRAAAQAYVWLSDRALGHWRSQFGARPVPRTERTMREFVRDTPITPHTAQHHMDVWLALGEFEPARAAAAQMPVDAPEKRFASAAANWLIQFAEGGSAPPDDLVPFVDAIAEAEQRAEATVEVAGDRARLALATGGDWRVPLAAVRPMLGRAPDSAWRRIVWLPVLRGLLGVGIVAVLAFWVFFARLI